MDLSINRLKVLGEEEIQRLDLKITEYKNSNQPSVLDKSINDIKTQISDLSSICNDLEIEVNSKNSIIGQLQNTLSEYHKKYETLNENILSIELSITEYENRKIELQSQFELMDNTISRLKIEEQKNKDSYEQLNIKLEERKIHFKSEKEYIDNQIKLFELKIKELMQSSLINHIDFIDEVKSIELKQEVNDVQAIFDSIKFDLLTKLSRNIFVYGKQIKNQQALNYWLSNLNMARS
jgi:chromosome segregation ATPase